MVQEGSVMITLGHVGQLVVARKCISILMLYICMVQLKLYWFSYT